MIADAFLCLLVLINLLFIHVTGIVPGQWSIGFGLLIVIAPFLRRVAERLAWRIAWDGVVVLLFVGLVLRTLQQGPERMLESGLILAMFCQIHLVNNLSRRQRPDLLLFNSFVIAVITAFFAQQASYCAVFVGYAYTFTVTWKLVAWRDGGAVALAPLVRESLGQTTWALALTGVVFLFWPRDFEREGLVSSRLFQVAKVGGGLVDRIGLERHGGVLSEHVVMRIRGSGSVPTHWRTTTYAVFDDGGWHADSALQTDRQHSQGPLWRAQGTGTWVRPGREGGQRFAVECLESGGRVPLPLTAGLVVLDPTIADVPQMPFADGTLALFGALDQLRFTTEHGPTAASPGGRFRSKDRARIATWLALDRRAAPAAALALARTLRASLPAAAPQSTVVEALRSHLETGFAYGLPGASGSAHSLEDFFVLRRGHCEFFAAGLALMLRSLDIPCRLVGGYLAIERDDDGTTLVRGKHAHAWVEVLDPDAGWMEVDPTPSAGTSGGDAEGDDGLLTWVRDAWRRVTDFSSDDRRRAAAWLQSLPTRAADATAEHPLAALAILACLAAWFATRRSRRVHAPLAVAAYRRAVRRHGLALAPGETPRQRLARATADNLRHEALAALAAATTAHERARYRRPRGAPGG